MKKIINFIIDNYLIFCIYALIGWIYEVSLYLIRDHIFVNRGVLFGPFLPIYGFGILVLLLFLKKFMKNKHVTNNIIWLSLSVFTVVTFITITVIEFTHDTIYKVDVFLKQYGILICLINILFIILLNIIIHKIKSEKIKNLDLTSILVFLFIWIITTIVEYVGHYITYELSHVMLWDYTKDFLNINSRVCFDASRNFAIGGTLLLYAIQPLLDKFLNKTKLNIKIIITFLIGIPMSIDLVFNVIL